MGRGCGQRRRSRRAGHQGRSQCARIHSGSAGGRRVNELFDIYDEALNHIGVKPREQVHRDGDWHHVFHCWVIGRDPDGAAFIVLQKRALDRDYPSKIDISAAGHLEAGESVCDGVREIEEELGLRVAFEDLLPLGIRIGATKIGDFIDRQFCHVYFYECDRALESYRYQDEEILGLVKLPIDEGIRLFSSEVSAVRVKAVGLGSDYIELTLADFIHSPDKYALKILILARRYFAGETRLWI
ncbi:MAG: NUDIX domain-containing protein [Chloroflexi bacterium]|nr:NUDIX domain-containing protein [Chloroflexota bacterium]